MSAVTKDFSALSPDSIVAVPAGYPMFISTAQGKGYTNVREYDTFEECVRSVYKGETDLTYIISMCEGYLLSHAQYSGLRAVTASDTGYGVCLGIVKSDELLLSIMNKALAAIPTREVNEIIVSNTASAVPAQTIGDIFTENGNIILILCAFILAILAFIGFHFFKARQQRAFTRELQQQHNILERLYDNLPCAILRYEYEAPHRILSCNALCAIIYGYDNESEFIGKFPKDVVDNNVEIEFLSNFEICKSSGQAASFIKSITRSDGSKAYTESVMDIVDTPQGKVFQELFIDVTKRILMEQETEKRYAQEIHKRGNCDSDMLYLAVFDITDNMLTETSALFQGIHEGITMSALQTFSVNILRITRHMKNLITSYPGTISLILKKHIWQDNMNRSLHLKVA